MIAESETQMTHEAKRLWHLIRLSPAEKWEQHPWGDQGGGFWVVAITGKTCLYYNDIEDGFNTSSFSAWGAIDHYVCDQIELQDVLNGFLADSS